MKALILDGSHKGDSLLAPAIAALALALPEAGYEITTVVLSDLVISSCRGDFGCWIKTPGECIIKDEARDIACGMLHSDLLVFLTPITFGGYSSELKKQLDRSIGLLSPEFKMINGEIHHRARYKRYPNLLGVGVLPRADAEAAAIFTQLVGRNAINFHSPWHSAVVLVSGMPEPEMRAEILRHVGQKKGAR